MSEAAASDTECGLPESGQLNTTELPEGTNVVDCGAVGREVDLGEVVLRVPPAGEGIALSGLVVSDERGEPIATIHAELATEVNGEVTYEADNSLAGQGDSMTAAADTDGCDTNYLGAIKRWKLTGAFSFYVDNEGQPGGSAYNPADTGAAIENAGETWNSEKSPCFPEDHSSAPRLNYAGSTSWNGDFRIVDGTSVCADRDRKSVVDTGNLDKAGSGTYVGLNCTWYETDGAVDGVLESDIRFNTTDVDFTYHPHATSCDSNDYDVLSVMTHETGHTYGLKDKGGSDLIYQTMYEASFPCRSFARNLGKSDVLHLRARY